MPVTIIQSALLYSILAALAIQCIYWLANLIAIQKKSTKTTGRKKPVSVIVCAHNELDNLKRLIPALLDQDHPDFEVVIVDDRSDDGTYDYLLEMKEERVKFVRVDHVHDHINAKKYAITLGVKAATHDILLFTDADCHPDTKNWIHSMTGDLTKKETFSIGVSLYNESKGLLNHWIRFESLLTAINSIGFALCGNPYMAVGRNLAYRKSFFLENNPFSRFQNVTGGDDDLVVNHYANKSNTIVSIGKEALSHSIPKITWAEYFHQKIRHISVSKYYRLKDKLLLGLQNITHSIFWIALISFAVVVPSYEWIVGICVARTALMVNVAYWTSKKLGDRMNSWLVPIFDILYVLYISVLGTRAIFTKKVKWKK